MREKQEPPRRVRSGAPTCSHPHGWAAPTTRRPKSPLTVRALPEVREGETPGKLRTHSKAHQPSPRKSNTEFDFVPHCQTFGTCKLCAWLYFVPIKKSPCVTDDNSLTKWSHRELRNRTEKFSSKTKGPTASISSLQRTPLLALSLTCLHEKLGLRNVQVEDRESQEGEQTNDIL